MKKFLRLLSVLFVITLLASCSNNPFMTNLFSGVDQYKPPSSFSSADDVLKESGDDGFLDALSEDPDLADQALTVLNDSLPADPADADSSDQESALLVADIELAVSGADETINNVNNLLLDVANGSDSLDFDDPSSLVADLFSSGATEAEISDQISSLLNAADALDYYGGTLNAGLDPSVEADAGSTAGTALISGMTSYLIDNMDITSIDQSIKDANPGASDEELAIAALTDVIVNGSAMPTINDSAAVSSLPSDASVSDTIEAFLGSDLTGVVTAGFDISAFDNM